MSNKNVSIKSATDDELRDLLRRMQMELELQNIMASIVRNSATKEERETLEYNIPIKVNTPIDNLYHEELDNMIEHVGVLGMKWGKRSAKRIAKNKRAYKAISDIISKKRQEKETHIKNSTDKLSTQHVDAIRTQFGKRAAEKILVNMSKKGKSFESEVRKAKFIKAGKKILIASKIGSMLR